MIYVVPRHNVPTLRAEERRRSSCAINMPPWLEMETKAEYSLSYLLLMLYLATAEKKSEKKNDCQPSKSRSEHIKGSKERYLLGQAKTSRFSGQSPSLSYKTTLKQQINGQKRLKMK